MFDERTNIYTVYIQILFSVILHKFCTLTGMSRVQNVFSLPEFHEAQISGGLCFPPIILDSFFYDGLKGGKKVKTFMSV